MLRRIKREVCFLVENFKITGLCAFLFCMGGILLWVSGGSTAYYLSSIHRNGLPVGMLFLLWLLVYGLTGVLMAVILLTERCTCGMSPRRINSGILLGLTAAAYVFMLCWYAVFFCTRLILFSVILLFLSVLSLGIIFVAMKNGLILAKFLIFLIEVFQIWSLYYCFCIYLLN